MKTTAPVKAETTAAMKTTAPAKAVTAVKAEMKITKKQRPIPMKSMVSAISMFPQTMRISPEAL